MAIQIAVISDLHCQSIDHRPVASWLYFDGPGLPAQNHPIESLLDLLDSERLSAKVLLVAGDLANQCSHAGLNYAWLSTIRLSEHLKAGPVVATVGNHDIQSHDPKRPNPFVVAQTVARDFPVPARNTADYWGKGYCFIDRGDLRILVVNTVAQHADQKELDRGKITDADLEKLSGELSHSRAKKYQVALLHHHPIPHEDLGLGSDDLVVNGSRLVDLLQQHQFHLVIHGHKHHPRLSYAGGASPPIPVFASGSLASSNTEAGLATNTRNLFHVVTLLDPSAEVPYPHGTIRSWEFKRGTGWIRTSWSSAGFPSEAGFGCHAPLADMASQVATWFQATGRQLIEWRLAATWLPGLSFLSPTDFATFERIITASHGIGLLRQSSDIPDYLGQLTMDNS